jgi:hypothetical protein
MAEADELSRLKAQVEDLTARLVRLEGEAEVRKLHHKYGYYLDACLYDDVVELFADNCQLKFLNGVYDGKAGVRRLYCDWLRKLWTGGTNGPPNGLMYDHLILQDVIDVAPDGLSAKGRLRAVMQGGWHETMANPPPVPSQLWEAGIYENEYVKDGGVWKIWRFDYNMLWQADYEKGWAHSGVHLKPLTKTFPEDPIGPDRLLPITPVTWPERRIVPFHYPHPVTGKTWKDLD